MQPHTNGALSYGYKRKYLRFVPVYESLNLKTIRRRSQTEISGDAIYFINRKALRDTSDVETRG